MTRTLLTRRLWSVAVAAVLFSAGSVITVQADPVRVTSGVFLQPDDDPARFQFFGTDGFVLGSFFIDTPISISPSVTCLGQGCTPGTKLNMSLVAGGDPPEGVGLGLATAAIVNGTEFLSLPFRLRDDSLQLTGRLRFNAPEIIVPPALPPDFIGITITAPFDLDGHVTAYAPDDLELLVPLFAVDLVGRGTVTLRTALVDGMSAKPEARYTFTPDTPPVPEPATAILFGTGIAGMVARAWKRKRTAEAR